MKTRSFTPLFFLAVVLTACSPNNLPPAEGPQRLAVTQLKDARKISLSTEERVALYLSSAKESLALIDSPTAGESARSVYNQAVTELTVLLRSSEAGSEWDRPRTFTHQGATYQLRIAKGTDQGQWTTDEFTSFVPASEVDLKTIKRRNRLDGLGGALVGIRKTDPLEPFSTAVGVSAPVTSVLDFKGNVGTLTLIDPT